MWSMSPAIALPKMLPMEKVAELNEKNVARYWAGIRSAVNACAATKIKLGQHEKTK